MSDKRSIDDAARATRSHQLHRKFDDAWFVKNVDEDNRIVAGPFNSVDDAWRVKHRLNLIAVLEAIMEPSERMVMAADRASYIWQEAFEPKDAWLSMLAEKISEVKEQQNA